MTTPEKGGILQDQKMAENAPPENDRMENDSPRKRRNNTGTENGRKCTSGILDLRFYSSLGGDNGK